MRTVVPEPGRPEGPGEASIRTFWTRQPMDPLDFVRTFGAVVETTGRANVDPMDYAHHEAPAGCARGKISTFAFDAEGWKAACYQFGDARHHALLVGCTNGTAAAAARCAELTGRREIALQVSLPGGIGIQVSAVVDGDAGDDQGARVLQNWIGIPLTVRAADLGDGRRYALCAGPLNDYLVADLPPGEDPAAFTVPDAMALADRFGLTAEPLRSRVAVLQSAAPGPPRARFFTCGEREHPSAPLTGLAVVALAARRLGWRELAATDRLHTAAGPLPFPEVADRLDGRVDVAFPALLVHLGPYGADPESRP
ncbi:MAG: hypothetical protein IPL96_00465 [Holophagaceae bacterium]|nr:hypothetical protein [Holophagaceae bacterium]